MKRLTTIGFLSVMMLVGTRVVFAADFAAVVDPYLKIQQALASDAFDGVKPNAAAVATAATALGQPAEKIAAAAKALGAAADLKAARSAFGALSDAVVAYADATKTPLGGDVKIAYCPMVKKPWLQKGTLIRNPYYGSAMLECGEIRK